MAELAEVIALFFQSLLHSLSVFDSVTCFQSFHHFLCPSLGLWGERWVLGIFMWRIQFLLACQAVNEIRWIWNGREGNNKWCWNAEKSVYIQPFKSKCILVIFYSNIFFKCFWVFWVSYAHQDTFIRQKYCKNSILWTIIFNLKEPFSMWIYVQM